MRQNHSSERYKGIQSASPFVRVAVLLLAGTVSGTAGCTCESNEQGHLEAPGGGDLQYGPAPRLAFDAPYRAACGELGITDPGREEFARAPYLQSVTSASAELVWVGAGDSLDLLLRNPSDLSEQVWESEPDPSASPKQGQQFFVSTNELLPGTIYCYELRDELVVLARGGFRTAPLADARVRFSALGDLGKNTGDQRAVRTQLESVDSEFVLITGDVAYDEGTLTQFEKYFFAVYQRYLALVPVFPATGNHDYGSDDASAFREVFRLFPNGGEAGRERWYSFDWGPVHVLVLDTQRALVEQASWMREDLLASNRTWNVVALHKPPFASGHHGSDAEIAEHFVPVFEELGVDLVLAGHEHHYERTNAIEDVVYVITGGGGRGTRQVGSSSFTAFSARVAHFVYIEASPEALTLHAIDATGVEFDSMRLLP